MKNIAKNIGFILEMILVAVFFYTAFIKLGNFTRWINEYNMIDYTKVLHISFVGYLVPFIEILTALFLIINKYKKTGVVFATGLMSIYTLYIYYKIYISHDSLCPCGGIFSSLTLDKHLIVNIILLIFSLILLYIRIVWKRENNEKCVGVTTVS